MHRFILSQVLIYTGISYHILKFKGKSYLKSSSVKKNQTPTPQVFKQILPKSSDVQMHATPSPQYISRSYHKSSNDLKSQVYLENLTPSLKMYR